MLTLLTSQIDLLEPLLLHRVGSFVIKRLGSAAQLHVNKVAALSGLRSGQIRRIDKLMFKGRCAGVCGQLCRISGSHKMPLVLGQQGQIWLRWGTPPP